MRASRARPRNPGIFAMLVRTSGCRAQAEGQRGRGDVLGGPAFPIDAEQVPGMAGSDREADRPSPPSEDIVFR
jgi:hypothetical protein